MKITGPALALFLVLLVTGSLFASLVFHMVDQYFCPFSSSDFCNGVEKFLFHLTYFKTSFLSFVSLFSALLLALALYLFEGRKRLNSFYSHLHFEPETLFRPQAFLRWLAIHTNSPTHPA